MLRFPAEIWVDMSMSSFITATASEDSKDTKRFFEFYKKHFWNETTKLPSHPQFSILKLDEKHMIIYN